MDRNRKIAIGAGVFSILLLALLFYLLQSNERYAWSETYKDDGDQPYDLSLFKGVLEESGKNFEVLNGLFADTSYLESSGNTMVFIAGYAWMDSTEAELLKRFVKNGNKLLISTMETGKTLRLLTDCEIDEDETLADSKESEVIQMYGEEGTFTLSYEVYNEPRTHDWVYIEAQTCFEQSGFFELDGQRYCNLITEVQGNGALLIHTTPLVFTNYHFRKDSVFNYVNNVLAKAEGETYYYLEPGPYDQPSGPQIGESPLKFILAHPSLKWAWYLTIILALLYVINSMRRKQRAIPVRILPENQTAAYLDMIYQLFRKEGRHRDIVQSQVKTLQSHLRNKYGLNAQKLNGEFYELASKKLKLDKKYLEQFFKQLERSRFNSTLSDNELLKIDREITEFYLRCP